MKCPHCSEVLAANTSVCAKCGKPLPTAPLETRPAALNPDHIQAAPIQLLRPSEIALTIPVIGETLFVQIEKFVLIGRRTPETTDEIVDVTPYSHYAQGISRRHAALYFKDGALHIRDLSSRNGTWVNGVRLPTGTARKLMSGDQLSMGDLDIFVHFIPPAE